jgi:hypothetical protein
LFLLKSEVITMLHRWLGVLSLLLVASPGLAQSVPGEGPRLRQAGVVVKQEEIEERSLSLLEIRRQGMLVFCTPFNKLDGYGDGAHDPSNPIVPGARPTLQGNGTFLRVNGLDGQTCLECHSIVSNASVPARLGLGGVGGSVTNAIFQPTFVDVAEADTGFDGRFINPPFLFGSGGVQLLADEMTEDLQALKTFAIANPGTEVELETKGIYFGTIRHENGTLDTTDVEGVDDDLVVRPFGRKGEFATVRGFDLGALQFHMGMQPVELVGAGVDDDRDGVADEIDVGEISALEIFNTNLERPVESLPAGATNRDVSMGRMLFRHLGCAGCHQPMLTTRGRQLSYRFPVEPDDPGANVFYEVDLGDSPAGFKTNSKGGLDVRLFADLKRHDMGPQLDESFGHPLDRMFTTARLWGVADTAPYLHDGRATTISEAILLHGGEAARARNEFRAASTQHQNSLLWFLQSLRTPTNPASDLQP